MDIIIADTPSNNLSISNDIQSVQIITNETSTIIFTDIGNQGIVGAKGDKGDTGNNLVFEDLTEDQKNELRGEVGSTSTNLVNIFYDILLS